MPIYSLGNKRGYGLSTRRMFKADYIRLSNLKIAYTFKGDVLEKKQVLHHYRFIY